jgi:hypothetical protein
MNRLPKMKKCPTLRDFEVRNTATSKTTHQTQTNPEIAKRKEHGTNILGFQDSKSYDFKS